MSKLISIDITCLYKLIDRGFSQDYVTELSLIVSIFTNFTPQIQILLNTLKHNGDEYIYIYIYIYITVCTIQSSLHFIHEFHLCASYNSNKNHQLLL